MDVFASAPFLDFEDAIEENRAIIRRIPEEIFNQGNLTVAGPGG